MFSLIGGLFLGLAAGSLVFELLPGSSIENINPGHVAIAAVPGLAGFLLGGAVWGVRMGKLAGETDTRRMAVAGTLGFVPITVALGIGLNAAEPVLIGSLDADLAIHQAFTLLFVPSAFLIAGVSSFAIGLGLRVGSKAWSLTWRVGLAAAVAFLAVNLLMEQLGWVVGAPRAAERATMLVVMFAGNLGAALVGGGVLGRMLVDFRASRV